MQFWQQFPDSSCLFVIGRHDKKMPEAQTTNSEKTRNSSSFALD